MTLMDTLLFSNDFLLSLSLFFSTQDVACMETEMKW